MMADSATERSSDMAPVAPPEPSSARLILTLGLAGLFSGLAIVGIFLATFDRIEQNRAEALQAAIFQVMPGTDHYKAMVAADGKLVQLGEGNQGENVVFDCFDNQGQRLGYAIPSEGAGFQDTIKLIYGLRPGLDKLTGMLVLESKETPGLGDKIIKSRSFVDSFNGVAISPAIEATKKGKGGGNFQIDAISGATISSKAVVKIINTANKDWLPVLSSVVHGAGTK